MNNISNKIQLYQTLATLNKKEWKNFLTFANCPLFNTNLKVNALLKFLEQQYPNFNFSKEECWQEIAADEDFNTQKLKDIRSLVFKILKKFLALQEIEKNEMLWDLSLLQQLRKRNLVSIYKSQETLIEKKLTGQILNDGWIEYKFLKEKVSFYQQSSLRNTEDHFQEVADSLDKFYILEKFKWTCEMLNHSRVINKKYKLHLVETIIKKLHLEHLQKPSISLYFLIYQTLTDPNNENHFYQLKQLLETETTNLSKEEAVVFYSYAQNYCISKINKGESVYMQELFEIYEQLLLNDLLLENNELAHPHYKNIVTLGLRLKKYDWSLNFIETYKNQINSDIRENAYHFSLASWYYEQENYEQVINLLLNVNFSDIYYEISSKYILLKVYFDSGEIQPLNYLVISFERYIRRNKSISPQNRQGILNFLSVLKKLVKIKEWKKHKNKSFIKAKKEKVAWLLEEKTPIVNLVWLKEKLKEV